jgi:hypothetical protein
MVRAQSRKHRGYETQRLIAKRWKANGLAPYAVPVGAGDHGEDILNSPEGLVVEIKARDTVTLPTALAQAQKSNPTAIPLVVWRHNGQGESGMDDWTVTIKLSDFEKLYTAWRNASNGNG